MPNYNRGGGGRGYYYTGNRGYGRPTAKRGGAYKPKPAAAPRRSFFRRAASGVRRYAPAVAATLAATKLGPMAGVMARKSLLGRKAVSLAKRAIGTISGKGDYAVTRNELTIPGSYGTSAQIGMMHGGKGTRVRHREYVRDVPSSTEFNNITFRIQPTNSQLFPWLSALAQNFEQYKILGLIFEFRSLSANALNSINTALGSVSMATQYNAEDTPFQNKQQVLNYQFGTSCKPADDMIHPLECDPGETPNQPLYVRIGNDQGDDRLYDFGVLNYVTIGMQQANVTIGELWVSYDIIFFKQRISSGLGFGLNTAMYRYFGQTFSPDDGHPLGTSAVSQFDSIGMSFEYEESKTPGGVDCTASFPIGTEGLYLVQNQYFGTGAPQGAPQAHGTIEYTNCEIVTSLYRGLPEGPGSNAFNIGVNTGTVGCIVFTMDNIIRVRDPNKVASLKWLAGTGWTMQPGDANSVGNLLFCQLNANLAPIEASLSHGHFSYRPSHDEKEDDSPTYLALEQGEDDDASSLVEIPGPPPSRRPPVPAGLPSHRARKP